MEPTLFDTAVYISALGRAGSARVDIARLLGTGDLWLSSVVLEELYAGARDEDRWMIERLEQHYERVERILVPNLADWTRAGRLLAQVAARYDFEEVGRGRLTNDALIAVSAGRMGITVITPNQRDFRRLSELWPFKWRSVTI